MDRYITKESIEGLIQKLGLPAGDEYSQDWEYEIASSELAIKTLTAYINRDDLSEDERFTLMHKVNWDRHCFNMVLRYCLFLLFGLFRYLPSTQSVRC